MILKWNNLPDNQRNLDISASNKSLYRGVVGNLSLVIGTPYALAALSLGSICLPTSLQAWHRHGKRFPLRMEDNSHQTAAQKFAGMPATDDLSRILSGVQYPLTLSFKILALASQATVTDAAGKTVLYTKQKMFKFREHVEIFTDSTQATRMAEIKANKVIDWSARYDSTDAAGQPIGSVGRKGWRSLWRSHYEVFNPGDQTPDFSIQEENPGAKLMDGFLGEIPIIGLASGYLFHPRYLATRSNGQPAMRIEKQAAFFEGKFGITKLGEMTPREELNLILSFMMLVMLERRRG